jgi:hypothetical protein
MAIQRGDHQRKRHNATRVDSEDPLRSTFPSVVSGRTYTWKILLSECRIRRQPFVKEVTGGRRRPREKGGMDDAVPDLVR